MKLKMKKLLMLAFTMMFVFTLAACGESNGYDDEVISIPDNEQEDTSEEIINEGIQDSTGNSDNSDSSEERIVVTLDSGEIIINVYDNPTSREFLEQLPLTLTFRDYGETEKISDPPEELTKEGAPSGYTPEREDFAYFSPWGNVTMFYDDRYGFTDGLIKLGEIESGVELLDDIDEDFSVSIEIIE
ncbi:cyclophilin-like fold protein [Halalkalibacter kiskunsagensis]|uniref:Cyclophilin-like fold protein n=1 Tax=Halalkalibacter kiskunsagensis TaxID=1548599 RepID=A0ABV6KJB3_9BACI